MLSRRVSLWVGLTACVVACVRTPVTNRAQFSLIPDGIMRGLGGATYDDMLQGERVLKKTEDAELLRSVGRRIARVADVPSYDWSFALIKEDDTVNAWCLPGGKIGFYTGILPALRNEAGMAFVMGHEVAHATAHHSAERLSQQVALLGGLVGLELYLAKNSEMELEQRAALYGALGVGAAVGVVLPFSRFHESEADSIGVMYMARAGYPPRESIRVWERMEAEQDGFAIPAFLSTHPSHERRQVRLEEWMGRANKRYQRNALPRETQKALWSK